MLKRHKDLLRTIVAPLRNTLAGTMQTDGTWQRGDLDRELERLGIALDGALTPLDALPNASATERRARYAAEATIIAAVNGSKGAEAERKRADARNEVIERAAYTWINRLLALRAMEARGLIDETLRSNPDYDGVSEALYILRSDAPSRSTGNDGGWWAVLEDACLAQAEALPGLFDLGDPAAALRPSAAALLRCIALVGTAPSGYTLEEADAAFADPDAIGWCYQFYQEAAKARVYTKLGSGGKAASRAEIAAATQLFTEPYMVQWLLQNSLGRSYHEAYPDSTLPNTWDYYIRQRPEGQSTPESPRPLEALDLIDPCCGSGHFLREAFDMFAAMYRERYPELDATKIADRVLERHLHGIDLDPRAAQLTALTLYLRAWEYVKAESKRQKAKGNSAIVYRPSSLNIATTPSGLSAGALQRHLRRHPEDRVMTPLLEGVFAALEQADILGSLLRPAEHIDAAIQALQKPHTMRMDFDADDAALRRTITALAGSDPAELKRMLLERVAQSFHAEAGTADDVAAQLFGREAEGGVRLLQLLDRKYAVVVTNPPYMGSKHMDVPLKKYVEQHYKAGRRDIYAAFILRCLELCIYNGRVAMVTMQSWMFMRSYTELRAISEEELATIRRLPNFKGLLRETTIEALGHLGSNAFNEITGEVVQVALLILAHHRPSQEHRLVAFRLTGLKSKVEKQNLLLNNPLNNGSIIQYTPKQSMFISIPQNPIVYWLTDHLFKLLVHEDTLAKFTDIRQGLATTDNSRFLRFFWEAPVNANRWIYYAKSGGHKRWSGLKQSLVDWEEGAARIISFAEMKFSGTQWSGIIERKANVVKAYKDEIGVTYSYICRGSINSRIINGSAFDVASIFVLPLNINDIHSILSLLNTRVVSFLLRTISQNIMFQAGTVQRLPVFSQIFGSTTLKSLGKFSVSLKEQIINKDLSEDLFSDPSVLISKYRERLYNGIVGKPILDTWLLAVEAVVEAKIEDIYKLGRVEQELIISETGTPAGFHPLLAGYDALPNLPADLELPPLPQEVVEYLAAHQRIVPTPAELTRIKARLHGLYEAGPGVKESEEATEGVEEGEADGEEAAVSGAYIPIPTETFLEELSVKMQIHPISVYWLLEELRREGARCKPEELRLLEDCLSVLVLRLLGHRWPKQIEAGEAVPDWADEDGIIPLTVGAGQTTLAERLRGRLRAEDGDLGAQRAEALLHELTGLSLEDWLRREFFKRHVRQFKYRPIAWHLASDPSVAVSDAKAKKRLGGRRQPAFECLIYYHACNGDLLARIRTQYVEPLLRGARQQLGYASQAKDDTGVLQANLRIQELEEFNRRLQAVAERGFASPDLDKLVTSEPLDRWSGDGYLAPADRDALLRQEQGWRVDLNDGVRVNIAPVQLAGLLASDVLKAVDAKKAIADRARWRSDERRWVREGKLPRCGWMGDDVSVSVEWTELAPQREAERAKMEEKRRAISSQGKTKS